jgi:hypothetical protein
MTPTTHTLRRVAGFIILEDGRAYASSNRATDRTVRAIAAEIADVEFGSWFAAQQTEFLGMGMVGIDLREIAPVHRRAFYVAARQARARAAVDGFEELIPGTPEHSGWFSGLDDLILMITLWEAGEPPENFNPHMREICAPTGDRVGPGWDQ